MHKYIRSWPELDKVFIEIAFVSWGEDVLFMYLATPIFATQSVLRTDRAVFLWFFDYDLIFVVLLLFFLLSLCGTPQS
jgi:hypothetical protein